MPQFVGKQRSRGRSAENPTITKLSFEVVRSEGGEYIFNFNNLPRSIKKLGAFPAYRCFSSRMPKLHQAGGAAPFQ